jgi:protein TonB
MPDSWMTRAEPQFVWSVPSGLRAIDADPVAPPASRDSRLARLAALGLSALVHAAVIALLVTVFLSARDLTPPPVLEIDIVAAATPEAPPAVIEPPTEQPPAPPAATPAPPPTPPPPVLAEPPPPPPEPPPPPPVLAAPPPPPAPQPPSPVAQPAEPPKPVQPAPRPAPPAGKPAATATSKGTEGPASSRPTEMAASANLKALVHPPPEYPRIAVQLREEGEVILTVAVGSDGLPKQITVRQSSGFGSLDQAAVKAMERWRFSPALSNGRPVDGTIHIPMRFTIKKN